MTSNVHKSFKKMQFYPFIYLPLILLFSPQIYFILIFVPHLVVLSGYSWLGAWGSLVALFGDHVLLGNPTHPSRMENSVCYPLS